MKMIILIIALVLISPASALEFRFNQSSTVEIPLQFDCDEIEILRYEDVPAEENLISELSSEALNNSNDSKETISKTDLKNFYKQSDFNVIGKTRKTCPASFKIKIPDDSGFYYLPVKIYAGSEESIQYVGIEVLEAEKEPEPALVSCECESCEEPMTLFESLLLTIVMLLFFCFGMLSYKIIRRFRRK